MIRAATTAVRAQIAGERHEQASRRDDSARSRDRLAIARDRAADDADQADRELGGDDAEDDPIYQAASLARTRAAADRSSAARDRERAARDREAAMRDRELLISEIERAHMDDLTGAYGRRFGEVLLRHEVERAQRTEGPLTLAVLTVADGSSTEPRHSYPTHVEIVGDAFLALRANLRPYDPIVRWGENQFVCVVAGVSEEDAHRRLAHARADIEGKHPAPTTIGLAVLGTGDSLDVLIERACAAPE